MYKEVPVAIRLILIDRANKDQSRWQNINGSKSKN